MRLVAVVSLAIALVALSPRSDACVNVTKADLDEAVKNVKNADAALESGDLGRTRFWLEPALRVLDDVKHSIDPKDGKVHAPDGTKTDPPDPSLRRRALRIDALSQSRSPKASAAVREAALKKLETEVLGDHPDPTLLADYGELLSRVPAREWQAVMTLRTLRDKDLIGSAYAYLALAQLERKQGDAKAEAEARERCKLTAKKPAICTG